MESLFIPSRLCSFICPAIIVFLLESLTSQSDVNSLNASVASLCLPVLEVARLRQSYQLDFLLRETEPARFLHHDRPGIDSYCSAAGGRNGVTASTTSS